MATLFLIIIYAAFISLGLPDSLLGVAWPAIQPDFNIPFSFAGIASIFVSGGTILSSLVSGKLIKKYGTGKVTFFSVMLTAVALLGFSFAPSFIFIILLAIPLGLGAGAVDSGLNEYVAEHYKSHHMSWLHCFWGVGAMLGPIIMSHYMTLGVSWKNGYLTVSLIQFALVIALFFTLPLWGKVANLSNLDITAVKHDEKDKNKEVKLNYLLKTKGIKFALVSFLFYCGLESTMGLWGSSYLVKAKGLDVATAAKWVSVFYGSITVGRFISGFITMRLNNKVLIRIGEIIILIGVVIMLLPLSNVFTLIGFILIGLGCAPVFPCMLHETPVRFGKQNSQSIMGIQMAVAYIGGTFLPPTFGFIANITSMAFLPYFILAYIIIMLISSEKVNHKFNIEE